jgi:Uma2 family endonuclease
VFFPGRPTLPRRGPVTIPPDIAVEVVSPSSADQRHDRITKLAEYAGFGVRFYWMLDPSARTFKGVRVFDTRTWKPVRTRFSSRS